MAYTRVFVRRDDKANTGAAYARYYSEMDVVLAKYRVRNGPFENPAIDIRFFIREIASNFLKHDGNFNFAHIDLTIDSETLDAVISVTHNGKDFDPLAPDSTCDLIKAAANRLKKIEKPWRVEAGLNPKFEIRFNLKQWSNLGETHVL